VAIGRQSRLYLHRSAVGDLDGPRRWGLDPGHPVGQSNGHRDSSCTLTAPIHSHDPDRLAGRSSVVSSQVPSAGWRAARSPRLSPQRPRLMAGALERRPERTADDGGDSRDRDRQRCPRTTPAPPSTSCRTRNGLRQGGVWSRLFAGVDLVIKTGDMVSLEGPSGSGKTTLLQLTRAPRQPTGARSAFEGRRPRRAQRPGADKIAQRKIGFVFQHFNSSRHSQPRRTSQSRVPEHVRSHQRSSVQGLVEPGGTWTEAGPSSVAAVRGEQQRVAIARALANSRVSSSPTSRPANLDSDTAKEVMATLNALRERRVTIVIATHTRTSPPHGSPDPNPRRRSEKTPPR